jgi:Protein kinase domain
MFSSVQSDVATVSLANGRFSLQGILGVSQSSFTYLALDNLDHSSKVIQEFFPSVAVTRGTTSQVQIRSLQAGRFQQTKRQFEKESAALIQMQHPNAIRVIETFVENNTVYRVMEWFEAQTIEQRLAKDVFLDENEAVQLLIPLLQVLETFHTLGLEHGAIKPSSVFIDANNVKLGGFGNVISSEHNLGFVLKRFLSQNQAMNKNIFSAKDLAALCKTFYQALTGQQIPPTLHSNEAKKTKSEFKFNPRLSPAFAVFLERGLGFTEPWSSAREAKLYLAGLAEMQVLSTVKLKPIRRFAKQKGLAYSLILPNLLLILFSFYFLSLIFEHAPLGYRKDGVMEQIFSQLFKVYYDYLYSMPVCFFLFLIFSIIPPLRNTYLNGKGSIASYVSSFILFPVFILVFILGCVFFVYLFMSIFNKKVVFYFIKDLINIFIILWTVNIILYPE